MEVQMSPNSKNVLVFVLSVFILFGYSIAQDINITGTVIDSATSTGISGATVKLKEYPQFTTTTNTSGSFVLTADITKNTPDLLNHYPYISGIIELSGNILSIHGAEKTSMIFVDIFQCNGSRTSHIEKRADLSGSANINIEGTMNGMFIISVNLNGESHTITNFGTNNNKILFTPRKQTHLSKANATYTLQVTATGYTTKEVIMPSTLGSAGTIRLVHSSVQTGVWTNITPSGVNLSSDFGVQDAIADPAHPGTFYLFVCLQGVYRSTDWGISWSHRDTDGQLEHGRPWGEAIAPDGSYMLASCGYPDNGNQGAWKSSDGGATWNPNRISNNNDPYDFDIESTNKNHVICAMHAGGNIFESSDAGETWNDKGNSGGGDSPYIFFVNTTTWLCLSQNGGGTRRTTNSGATWTKVGDMEHAHGNAQMFIDPDDGSIYIPDHGGGGVYRSTDNGATYTKVSNIRSSSIWGTDTHIYAMDPGANSGGTAPMPQSTLRSNPTGWSSFTVPSGMTNGAKRAAVAYDNSTGHWVIVTGNWNGGAWRYVEP
jgi:photosystem II stability/assembly factor-like uncharacterized protein